MAPNIPKVEYQLENTVAGKPKPSGPFFIEDKRGIKVQVPYPPKKKCNHCYSRGYVGKNLISNKLVICRWCYPMIVNQ